MKRVFSFIKEHRLKTIIVFLIFVSIVTGLTLKHQFKRSSPPSISPESEGPIFKSIIPGKSTEKEVNDQLGEALSETQEESKKILKFKSTSLIEDHEIIIEKEKVAFIKETFSTYDNKKAKDLIQKYGEPPYTLFDQSPNSTFSLFVYPEKGFAYLGHQDGTVFEIWYFSPTTIDEFLKQWSKNYSFEKPSPIQ